MPSSTDYLLAAIVVLALLVLVAAVWYHNPKSWKSFSFTGTVPYSSSGTTPEWDGRADLLRFRACAFTVTDPSGNKHTQNVTPALNGMASAYNASSPATPSSLVLDKPLNPFSFTIPGVNDSKIVPDPSSWASCATTLVGQYRML